MAVSPQPHDANTPCVRPAPRIQYCCPGAHAGEGDASMQAGLNGSADHDAADSRWMSFTELVTARRISTSAAFGFSAFAVSQIGWSDALAAGPLPWARKLSAR